MTNHSPPPDAANLDKLSKAAAKLGYEIVDISGFLEMIDEQSGAQLVAVRSLTQNAATVTNAAQTVARVSETLRETASSTRNVTEDTLERLRKADETSQSMASWVQTLSERTTSVKSTVDAVGKNNQQIAAVARQVNTLAINAKIEAARAGDAGRGFSVVADAINDLSRQTGDAAVQISENLQTMTSWVMSVSQEAQDVAEQATQLLEMAQLNNGSLTTLMEAVNGTHEKAELISTEAGNMQKTLQDFGPSLKAMDDSVRATTDGITQATQRVHSLIDTSEAIVQGTAAMGATGDDSAFITFVQSAAKQISDLFDQAITAGRITEGALFDSTYTPIPGTNPEQQMTPFTEFTDSILPQIQEPALDVDDKVIFCAAVDTNGYLPTHNRKFSQPQGPDPVWNTANCRNRRIFDDRVGLKAGRNTEPFLVQVYRRDMGGGTFVMMKDISAPIFARGRHWGGLRFAVKF